MLDTIIKTIITVLISSILGYCISTIKQYSKRLKKKNNEESEIKDALKYLIQSNLTNTYFAYQQIGEIPDYVYKNWLNLFRIYKALGGNEFVDTIEEKMRSWSIKPTDILKK